MSPSFRARRASSGFAAFDVHRISLFSTGVSRASEDFADRSLRKKTRKAAPSVRSTRELTFYDQAENSMATPVFARLARSSLAHFSRSQISSPSRGTSRSLRIGASQATAMCLCRSSLAVTLLGRCKSSPENVVFHHQAYLSFRGTKKGKRYSKRGLTMFID
ncbi:hypothetical protein GQ43DRAFT_163176 [Delitschia confertaspora ATCC 74209]|uniref:Uncharacterized protein n=1 Tax=Delitschia confertaspora ATCC 74209 TaxID=1513339 RepID=A0A9P4JHJ2_9PLEO|nr:hypothetical protein GQ43DRAFT_163176 [Delitschia confertaspora ATCC 74209]